MKLPFASSLAVVAAVVPVSAARADVRLPALFSDHMVLQQRAGLPVWGTADPGEKVTVQLGGQAQTTEAGADGKWRVKLAPVGVGGPHVLQVQGKNRIAIQDVLVGEVWVGSGQSNMAMRVNRAREFEREQGAARFPQVRMFTVATRSAETAQSDCKGSWVVCSPETVAGFSATAYFFGRELHQKLGVPVGLINTSVGGTPIEAWISPEAQRKAPELKVLIEANDREVAEFDLAAATARYEQQVAKWKEAAAAARAAGKPAPRRPRNPVDVFKRHHDLGGLFNGMVAPLVPYAIRGMIWYQGEANSSPQKAPFYRHQLPLLVRDWRERWGQGEFPFAWVQLPNFTRPGEGWSLVREAMLQSLSIPKTGMAITLDVGDPKDIHPTNKQEVGRRLALWALGVVYEQPGVRSGPLPAGHEVRGREIVVRFNHTDGGLTARGGELKGFEIAGKDGKWLPATARIDGERIVVSHPEVAEPVAARYAWADNPEASLFNGAGLPASPFRTKQP